MLERSAKSADGSYRAVAGRGCRASRLAFRYYGTRPDDPNDVVAHEHRRELRALQVFGAWTNLVDMKAGNTLDTLVTAEDRGIVKHYLQDVGSTSAPAPTQRGTATRDTNICTRVVPRSSASPPLACTWLRGRGLITSEREIGKFEGTKFEPEDWRPRTPIVALRHARPDDTLWAALRVMAFTDEQIRTAVKPEATPILPLKSACGCPHSAPRQDRTRYTARINPLTRFAMTDSGLTFQNPAVKAGYAEAPKGGTKSPGRRSTTAPGNQLRSAHPRHPQEDAAPAPSNVSG